MEWLRKLGNGDTGDAKEDNSARPVEIVERRGIKRVVFSAEAADCLAEFRATTSAPAASTPSGAGGNSGVIAGE